MLSLNLLVAGPLLLQVVLPLVLVAWIAAGTRRRAWELTLDVALGVTWIAVTAVAGLWLALPRWIASLLVAVLALAVAGVYRRRQPSPCLRPDRRPAGRSALLHRAGVFVRMALLLASAGGLVFALAARRAPADAIPIAFPLEPGSYLVASGGTNALVNAHYATLSNPRFAAFRGQSHGVDLVGLGRWGSRRHGIAPRDPAAYAIFGAQVLAPCAGTVVRVVDAHSDMPVPQRDRTELAGNHVILDCGGVWIVLGHFQRGSIRVAAGQKLQQATPLGRVGNSGNSDEPHLHVHAQTPGTADAPLSGNPLHVRFGDRCPVRNQRITG